MGFTRKAEDRIASATKRVEGMPPNPPRSGPAFGPMGDRIHAVKITENMGATTSGEAAGLLCEWTCADEQYADTEIEITVVDPFGIFSDGTSGSYGFAFARGGNDRTVFILIQLECPSGYY